MNDLYWEHEPDTSELRLAYDLTKSDPAQAIARLKALADRGSLMSMAYLGDASAAGTGTNVDLSLAEEWYRRAAEGGSVYGSYRLGRVYFKRKQFAKAAGAFEIGASKDYMPCISQLGRMHIRGQGVEKNINKGLNYLERASACGYVYAKHDLSVLLLREARGARQRFRGMLLYVGAFKDLWRATMIDKSEEKLR